VAAVRATSAQISYGDRILVPHRHRGKLDVPKERFISYAGASRDGDASLLIGWAGWDHREQAQAIATLRSATASSTSRPA
jgi:hypothetical protein